MTSSPQVLLGHHLKALKCETACNFDPLVGVNSVEI